MAKPLELCAHCDIPFESKNRFPLCGKCFETLNQETLDNYIGSPKTAMAESMAEKSIEQYMALNESVRMIVKELASLNSMIANFIRLSFPIESRLR